MLFHSFVPDLVCRDIYQIDLNLLKNRGISLLIFDIDNTLAPYETAYPDNALYEWLTSLGEKGFSCAFISNNNARRVDEFNSNLNFFAVADAKKPSIRAHKRILSHFGAEPKQAALIGDQIFTDVCSGKFCGMFTVLVPPIKDKKSMFFRFKRMMEKPFLKLYKKR